MPFITFVSTPQTPPPQEPGGGNAEGVSDAVHLLVLVLLSFAPATVASIFPEGVLEDKSQAFLFIYFVTLPLALAASLITIGFLDDWFGTSGWGPVVWPCAIIIATSFIAVSTAPDPESATSGAVTSYMEAAREVAHPIAKLVMIALYIVSTYAFIYGIPLFFAGILVGSYAGYRAHRLLSA